MADQSRECVSTEDFLSKITEFNNKIKSGQINSDRLMIGSLDVESLYGSIDAKIAAKIVKKRYLKSEIKTDGVDWRWCLIYLKLTMTPHEVVDSQLQGILPRKIKGKNNSRPRSIKSCKVDEKE